MAENRLGAAYVASGEGSANSDGEAQMNWTATYVAYHMYDKHGVLLYIGSSKNFGSRVYDHFLMRKWTRKVTRIDLRQFKTLSAARRYEGRAIRKLRPALNLCASLGIEKQVRYRERK